MTQTLAGPRSFCALLLFSTVLFAQPDSEKPATDLAAPIDKRVFGVLPNYRTADGNAPYTPITAKRKLWIGFKDSFDYPVYFTSAIFGGINQLENTSPQFGQGLKGYGKRYITSYADQMLGNIMTESLFPIMLKQDPRYFSVGRSYGGPGKRVRYAISRVLLCRSDAGKTVVNFSEIVGNSTAVAISNFYYTDNRNFRDNVEKLGIQIGTDALSNVLKEFWPDIKRKYFNKNKAN